MTPHETFTVKEMLEKMETRSISDRAETNGKIDRIYDVLEDHVGESRIVDKDQDKRIGILENWKSFVMGAVWLLSGSGAITGIVFFIKSLL